ncbi:hypothetical protein DUNSADRAFT_9852, partial [Dunaliella salina]
MGTYTASLEAYLSKYGMQGGHDIAGHDVAEPALEQRLKHLDEQLEASLRRASRPLFQLDTNAGIGISPVKHTALLQQQQQEQQQQQQQQQDLHHHYSVARLQQQEQQQCRKFDQLMPGQTTIPAPLTASDKLRQEWEQLKARHASIARANGCQWASGQQLSPRSNSAVSENQRSAGLAPGILRGAQQGPRSASPPSYHPTALPSGNEGRVAPVYAPSGPSCKSIQALAQPPHDSYGTHSTSTITTKPYFQVQQHAQHAPAAIILRVSTGVQTDESSFGVREAWPWQLRLQQQQQLQQEQLRQQLQQQERLQQQQQEQLQRQQQEHQQRQQQQEQMRQQQLEQMQQQQQQEQLQQQQEKMRQQQQEQQQQQEHMRQQQQQEQMRQQQQEQLQQQQQLLQQQAEHILGSSQCLRQAVQDALLAIISQPPPHLLPILTSMLQHNQHPSPPHTITQAAGHEYPPPLRAQSEALSTVQHHQPAQQHHHQAQQHRTYDTQAHHAHQQHCCHEAQAHHHAQRQPFYEAQAYHHTQQQRTFEPQPQPQQQALPHPSSLPLAAPLTSPPPFCAPQQHTQPASPTSAPACSSQPSHDHYYPAPIPLLSAPQPIP